MWRLLWSALGSRKGESAALALLAILAVAAATATPMYMAAADRHAVEAELEAATPGERSITVNMALTGADIVEASERLRERVREFVTYAGLTEVTGGWVTGAAEFEGEPTVGVPLVARSGFCEHLQLTGACAATAGEVVISQSMADQTGLGRGDELPFRIFNGELLLRLTVTGVYAEEGQYANPYWAGRTAMTPAPRRAANPVFTPAATIVRSGVDSATATADLIAGPGSLDGADFDDLAGQLRKLSELALSADMSTGLRWLVGHISQTKALLLASLPPGALQLLVFCWLVLLLTITYGAVQRQAQSAVSALRGAPARYRIITSSAPAALVLLLLGPLGVAAGWLAAQLSPRPPVLTPLALAMAGATVLIVLMTAAVATWRANAVTLQDALRSVPSRRGGRGLLVAEVMVGAVAVLAVIQVASGDRGAGVGILAPLAVAAAAGLLCARLVRYGAGVAGVTWLERGRLSLGLASLQLARRPGADRLVALMVIAVALAGHAIAAWDISSRETRERAATELGSARVIDVVQVPPAALLAAVRKADPAGEWAMAVTRLRTGTSPVVALDSPRLASVTGSVIDPVLLQRLRPQAPAPLTVTGAEVVFTFAESASLRFPLTVTAGFAGPDGQPAEVDLVITPGQNQVKVATPRCVQAPGCRLAWLDFARGPNGLSLTAITQNSPDRTVLTPTEAGTAARWRLALDGPELARLVIQPGSVTVYYTPPPRDNPRVKLSVADAPLPLPVLAAGEPSLVDSRELTAHPLFGARERPVLPLSVSASLPGLSTEGVLADLELSTRLADTFGGDGQAQVWLSDSAPSDVDKRLREVGLIPISSKTSGELIDSLDARGAAPGARLQLAAALLGILLLLPAFAVVVAADKRSRTPELRALRVQGMPKAVVRKATGGYGLLVAAAFPIGLLVSYLTWGLSAYSVKGSPSPLVLGLGLAAAGTLLWSAAQVAKQRLWHATGEPS
jgi:putative ABC transport system permease protein